MEKKGISAVVATVLIILITIATISIIWVAIIPIFKNDGSDSSAFDSSAEIINSRGYTFWDEDLKVMSVQVRLNKLGSDAPIGIQFIFQIDGSSVTVNSYSLPSENGAKVYAIPLNKKPIKVSIALIYKDKIGDIISEIAISDIKEGDASEIDENNYLYPGGDIVVLRGNLWNNANDVNSSYGREYVIFKPLQWFNFFFNSSKGYYIRFTSGDDSGGEYEILTSNSLNYYYYDTFPGAIFGSLVLILNSPTLAAAGDSFEIYVPQSSCGDNICLLEESCSKCSADCGLCNGESCMDDSECEGTWCVYGICRDTWAVCGDGLCDAPREACGGNSSYICEADCGVCQINNGICEINEGCAFAPECGPCECGDGTCDAGAGETNQSCWTDCGYDLCGNGVIDAGETKINCAWDAGEDYKTTIYSSLDIGSWATYNGWFRWSNTHGRTFLISPQIYEGSNIELFQHWLTADYTASSGGKIKALVIDGSLTDIINVMNNSMNELTEINSGITSYKTTHLSKNFMFIVLEINPDVTINTLNHTYILGHNSYYGHKLREFKFANYKLVYRILYPNNYNPSKSYPLVVTPMAGGSLSQGFHIDGTSFSYNYCKDYYFNPEFEAFILNVQEPINSLSTIPAPYRPHEGNVGGTTPYHGNFISKEGYYTSGTIALINEFINNPNMNINTSRIYATGFSQGGMTTYALARTNPNLWAAIWPMGVWAIDGNNYSDANFINQFNFDISNYYGHFPIKVSMGANDPINNSANFSCYYIDNNGGDCTYISYPGIGHSTHAWGLIDEVQWLFNQSKP